jgi:hypothetical protein
MIVGAITSLYFLSSPINLVAGATAVVIGLIATRAWQCGHCGAHVDRDAAACPRCVLPFSN